MSIENILKRIEEETAAAVGEIISEAESEAEKIREDYTAEAGELKVKLERQARTKAEEEQRRLLVNEELRLRKELLKRKREILDALYVEAAKRIESLERDEYLELMKMMIQRRATSFEEEIVVPEDQREIFGKEFLDSLNKTAGGKKGAISISDEPGDFSWGVILREGKRSVDLTLDVLIAQLRDRIEPDIAAVLFADE
jgi:V/A-type H+-transporting ATPase subunit E